MPVEIAPTPRGWSVALDLDPDDDLHGVARKALDVVRDAGGGTTTAWVTRASDTTADVMRTLGFEPWRDLLQLRVALPLDATTDIETRPFVVGTDEVAWLEVNNRAFDWHPEQGGWTLDDVRSREAEEWFDPAGFLLHERDGRLAGFNWTKVHAATDADPAMGEIYVIGVDPDFHGLGLGKALSIAGLDHLARSRGMAVGMLYVESDNEKALGTYTNLGFTAHHVDRAFTITV